MCYKMQHSKKVAEEVLEDFMRFMDVDRGLPFRALMAPKVRQYLNDKYRIETYSSKMNKKESDARVT